MAERTHSRCTFDCKHFGAGHGVTFWRNGVITFVGDFHKNIIASCQPCFCKHPDHPLRGPLPACARYATTGALVEPGDGCSLTPDELALF